MLATEVGATPCSVWGVLCVAVGGNRQSNHAGPHESLLKKTATSTTITEASLIGLPSGVSAGVLYLVENSWSTKVESRTM